MWEFVIKNLEFGMLPRKFRNKFEINKSKLKYILISTAIEIYTSKLLFAKTFYRFYIFQL